MGRGFAMGGIRTALNYVSTSYTTSQLSLDRICRCRADEYKDFVILTYRFYHIQIGG